MRPDPILVIEGVVPTRAEMRGVTGVWTSLNRWNGLAVVVLAVAFLALLPAILSADGLQRALALLLVPLGLAFVFLRSRWAGRWQDAVLESPLFSPPPSWLFDSDGFEVVNAHYSSRVLWSAVTFIDEDDRLVFALGPNLIWVLPRRLLDTEQARVLSATIAAAESDAAHVKKDLETLRTLMETSR